VKLYNTLSKQLDEIEPANPPVVTVYTCGPTVYDYAHVGHWFNYVRMDLLIRTLKANGQEPKWVMNITDVGHLVSDADDGEDKLEKGAKREGKSAWDIAKRYTDDFVECMTLLNITQPNEMPKATDHIQEQIELIQKLESKGFTYQIDDGIYYDTSKFEGYAAFALLDLDEQQAGARVAINQQKHSQSDFALWKFSPQDRQRDMEWDSPWGKGFPGWHIECSAMSMKYLGETLDIHTGGIDHVPVHHTNEIAQSEAATGKRFANHWMHGNHLMVEGGKISKSLGNGIRLQEVVEKGFSPEVLRLYVLESHYRTHAQFSWDGLQAAKNRLNGYHALAVLRWQLKDLPAQESSSFTGTISEIKAHLSDDLATPAALSALSAFTDLLADKLVPAANQQDFEDFLRSVDDLLGLRLMAVPDITDDQKQLLEARERSRGVKDWSKADEQRDQLAAQGVGLRDTEHGAIWFRL
jgi:cysteinyl-tRNA synthetase